MMEVTVSFHAHLAQTRFVPCYLAIGMSFIEVPLVSPLTECAEPRGGMGRLCSTMGLRMNCLPCTAVKPDFKANGVQSLRFGSIMSSSWCLSQITSHLLTM